MRTILVILFAALSLTGFAQTYNPLNGTVSNKPYSPSQKVPTDGRSWLYDSSLFKWRPYQSVAEANAKVIGTTYRAGNFPVYINIGGILNVDGTFTGGIIYEYWWRNGLADSNLVRKYNDQIVITPKVDTLYRKNDSTVGFTIDHGPERTFVIKGTAALGSITSLTLTAPNQLFGTPVNFTNASGAWSGSLVLNNQNSNYIFAGPSSGGPGLPSWRQMATADLPTGIPNGNLQNSSINFSVGTAGSSPNWTTSTVPLGGNAILNLPITSSVNTGVVTPSLYNIWIGKVDSTVMSNDSVYEYRNGTRFFRYIIVGGGSGISSLNGLTGSIQTFATGTSGTDFNISSVGTTHTFNFPTASASNRGLLSTSDWTSFNAKLTNITGLVTQGSNVTITGSGTSGSPYVINSSGGGASNVGSVKTISNLYSFNVTGLHDSSVLVVTDTIAGGVFIYRSTSTAPEDSGTVFKPTTGPGMWYRQYYGLRSVRFWGVNGDGSTNNTRRIQLAFNSCVGGALFFPSGIYMVDSLIWPAMLSIRGESRRNTRLQATAAGAQSFIRLGPGQSNEIYWIDISLVANASNAGQNAFDFTAVPGSTTGGLWNFEMDRVDVTNFRGTGIKLECIDQAFDMAHQFLTFRQVRVFCTSDTSSHALIFRGQVNQTTFEDCEFDGPTPSVANTVGILLISAVGSNDQIVGANTFHNISVQGFDKGVFAFNAQGCYFNDDYFESDSVAIHATASSRMTVHDIHLSNVGNTRYVFGNDNSVLDILGYRLTPNPISGRFYTSPAGTPGGGVIQRGVGQTTNSITTVFIGQNVNVSGNALSTGYFTDIVTNVGLSKSNYVNTINSSLSTTETISITANDQSHTGGFLWFKSASGNITLPANMDSTGLILRENQTAVFLRSDILGTWRLISVSQPEIYLSAYPTSGSWFTGEKVYNSTPTTTTAAFWVCKQGGQPGTWDSVVVGPGGGGGGGVSSVGLSLPVSLFSISGSPVTSTGTLTGTLISQSAYTGFGNWTASSAVPTFGKIPYQAFANGTANGLLGFDGSGNPTILQPDTLFFKNVGSGGLTYGWMSGDTIYHPNFKNGTGISITKGADSSFTITSTALIDPLTTNGDILARISGTSTRLAQGSNNTFLGVQSGTLGYYAPFALTTTGTSGPATFTSGTLNIPQYSAGGSGDSGIVAGFGTKVTRLTATYREVAIDTINSYYLITPITGLNNKIVIDGNSNSVGQNLINGTLGSYGRKTWRSLDSTLAVYAYTNVGLSGITTPQMITRGAVTVDTALDLTKTKIYLFAWEGENDASANPGSSSLTLATNLNTYWTARKTAGWPIVVGGTGLGKTTASFNADSLLNARIDSMNLALVNSHTSDYFIDFRQSPWLNNYRSHAGFLADLTHLNQSGTTAMSDLFTNIVKGDQSQPFKIAPRPVFWGGNSPDRTMLIGALNFNGVSLVANNIPVFDVTPYGGIAMVGTKIPEFSNLGNIAIDLIPRFGTNSSLTGWKNYDIRLNQNAEWTSYGISSYKYAFWQPATDAFPNLCNFGIGPDVFRSQDVRQTTFTFNTAIGNRIFQAASLGNYNTFVGSFGGDTHITGGNTFVSANLNVGTIGDNNTFIGARGTINNNITLATNLGYNNNVQSSSGITIGNAITAQSVATEGGSIIIGQNITDGAFKSYVIANRPFGVTDANPTADGQMIIGGIYNPSGKEIRYFSLAGNQAAAVGISNYFSAVTLTVGGIAGGGSNTNLSAKNAEFRIYGSVGTGNAASGEIVLGTAQKGASGTARQTIINVLRIDSLQNVDIGEPSIRFYGLNVNRSVSFHKDSIPHVTSTAAMECLVIDTTGGGQVQVKRITIPSGGSGVTTVGAFSGSSIANGASISGSTITFGPADGTNPGMVTTGTQTFAGDKTFGARTSILSYVYGNGTGKSASFTVSTGDGSFIILNGLSSNATITLPSASGSDGSGRVIEFQNTNTNLPGTANWSFASTVTDNKGTTVTNLIPGYTYKIYANAAGWQLLSAVPPINSVLVTSGSTANIGGGPVHYIFTGSTATWTLPTNSAYNGVILYMKNAGSGNITLNASGSDTIYDTSSVTTITITPGTSRMIVSINGVWYVE